MRPRVHHAFTLVEIMVVIAIIVILVGTVVAIGTQARASAQIKQTKLTLRNLHAMLEVFRREVGGEPNSGSVDFVVQFSQYPATKKAMAALPPGTFSASQNVLDGFGNPITFEPTNGNIPGRFRSYGADGVPNNADDVLSTDP